MAATQGDTLPIYTALRLLRDRWGGRLVLATALDEQGCALTMAALAAGAAVLTLEPEPQRIKEAVHSGCCDFAVTTLDEALRILKNEIRQLRPVSVALVGRPDDLLPTLASRGVLPDLLLQQAERIGEFSLAFAGYLARHGSATGSWSRHSPAHVELFLNLQTLLQQETAHLVLAELPLTPASGRVQQATAVADTLAVAPRLAQITQRWMELTPRLFPRDRTVNVWQPAGS